MGAPADPILGHMIRGYRLEERLGAGKLTALYLARTEELWLPSELTIMLLHMPAVLPAHAKIQFTERFTREASRLIKLRHPSLHPLLGYGEEAGQLYLLFPTPSSTTLGRYLHSHGHWSPSEVFAILAPLSSAFDYLHHQGLAHQFFTPGNILLQQQSAPQITGAGLLQLLLLQGLDNELYNHEPHRHLKNIAGDYASSLTYMAPEVIRGEPANTRSDIYSLGILLFELLSGQPPFTGETPADIAEKHLREPLPSLHALAPTVPVALELVINRALHRNPAHRFATAGELLTAFSHVLNERLRSPAYLSLEQPGAKTPAGPLPALTHERHPAPAQRIGNDEYDKETLHTSTDLPALFIENETHIATTEPLNGELLLAETHRSGASSLPEHIHKMAQHVQILRERIQGEYKI
jgi:serine/threonine-protein kinase